MEQPRAEEFKRATGSSLPIAQAISNAREALAAVSGLPVDSVSRCERSQDGGWSVVIDLIESSARMGENDLISVYAVVLDHNGTPQSFDRLGRYRREDGGL